MSAVRLAVLALVFLGACTRSPDRRVHIRIWHQKIGGERDLFQEKIREYNREHPATLVESLYKENEELRNLYVIAAVAGQGPDLIYGPSDNVGVFVTTQTILPLDSVLPESVFQEFAPQGVVAWKGSRWLLADQIGNHLALVYDKAKVANPPATLSQLIEVARSLTRDLNGDGKMDEYGLTWNYREPFFFIPFLTGFGGWVIDEAGRPTLDTPEMVKALQFVLDLRDKYQVIPKEGDYEIADMLFKEHRTAMIINGPWSWAAYHVPAENMLALLPKNEETGMWCEPMVSAKGYSVNASLDRTKLPALRDLLEFLTGAEMQREMAMKLATTPVAISVMNLPELRANAALAVSMEQISHGRALPIVPQMRAIWEGMRGPYQLLMNGAITAPEAARQMQREAEKNIADANL